MDEAEKYQQRLQAIAEKRRVQEEENRVRRETEEEWLKLAQRKRKSQRDQWLMELTPSTAEASGTDSAPRPPAQRKEDSADETHTEGIQKELKEEDEKSINMGHEQPALFMEHEPSNLSENNTEKPAQANPREEEKKASANFKSAFNPEVFQNRKFDRSVLGVLEVQVERDLKTGATTIKSMSPQSIKVLETTEEAVFDDGQCTVHAVGRPEGSQHSEEELSQILNAISEVGMQTILDDVAPTCNVERGGQKDKKLVPEVEQESIVLVHEALQRENMTEKEDNGSLAISTKEVEEGRLNESTDEVDNEEVKGKKGEREAEEEKDEWQVVNRRPEEGLDPVVLTFLGFTQVQADQGFGYEDKGAVVKVEKVFIGSEEDSEMGPIEGLSSIKVEDQFESQKPELAALSASCPEGTREDTPSQVTFETLCTDRETGKSVHLQELSSLSDIMDTEEGPDNPVEIQQNPPCILTETTEKAKDVFGYSTGAAKWDPEEQDMHTARTGDQAKGLEKTEIKQGSHHEDEVVQDIQLHSNGETSQTLIQKETEAQTIEQEPENQALVPSSITPNRAEGEISNKSKTCQCCTLM